MSNVWTESEYLMKRNDRNHEKKFFDDFPSGGGHFDAKNVKICPKHLSCPVDSTVFILEKKV